jgi:RNA polymerase sigma-70 factor (ECF subfamily)
MLYSVAMTEYLSLDGDQANPPERWGDEEVLAASVEKPALFALLVRRYEEAFLRKALSIVRGQEEAEDVVQEAFLKIYRNASKFKVVEGASFSSWGYRILINTALTHYARAKRRGANVVELDDEIWQLIPDKNLRQFEKKELLDEIASVLSRLPAPLARALSAFFIEGKSQEEIAKSEGLSVGAIKTRVHRAKREFKKVYETITTHV